MGCKGVKLNGPCSLPAAKETIRRQLAADYLPTFGEPLPIFPALTAAGWERWLSRKETVRGLIGCELLGPLQLSLIVG